ncbi:phosphoglucosamine mutase [Murdochiella massiliensis]|uniref:phosphoglucosamine mutase n=1 Tax=Murdochiella massiliensis TaxID=1673723 RepID=UPI00082A1E48|nr:phosphoglucosamine mutase [Murdochiella massiliensis]
MKYFGTDGFRGEANQSLTAEHAMKIGRYLGAHFLKLQKELRVSLGAGHNMPEWAEEKRPRIVIGKDTRRSSYMLENALAAGITTSGCDVGLMHVTTTPSVSYAVRAENFCCGIMISASHNPFYDNGIKIINSAGGKMEEELLEEIERYIDAETDDLPLAQRGEIGMVEDYSRGRNRYIGYLIQTVRRSFKRMRIGLDCANGASFTVAKNVFDALGAETHVIHDQPNGLNINLDCGSTHIQSLVDLVKSQKLDCGFAFDGDADRCIAVDNHGKVVDGDAILYICGKEMKANDALPGNTVVTTIMSNFGLYKAFERAGIQYAKTPVGDKNVVAEMFEHGYALGGEQSGHIIFSKYATTGDGVLTALRLAEIVVENKTDLASLHQDLIHYPQVLRNLLVEDKEGALANERVQRAIAEANRVLGEEGRSVVRASGTEPLIRVMVEHLDSDLCEEMAEHIVQAFRDEGFTA